VLLIAGAFGLFTLAVRQPVSTSASPKSPQETALLEGLQKGLDHMEPQELADRLLAGDPAITLVDIRTPREFAQSHIRSAVNIQVKDLPVSLAPYKNQGLIVLYSNGMTHPAQARDSLFRFGFKNVYFLTDGLDGFLKTCLKPVSLRSEPVSRILASKINAWRAFFLAPSTSVRDPAKSAEPSTSLDISQLIIPGLVETDWLNRNLGKPNLKIIYLRA
jgi:thiosulfate/3-mercaptopyruvate sulfurtransferase